MWQVGVVAVASRAKGIAGSVGRDRIGVATNVTRGALRSAQGLGSFGCFAGAGAL
ncbi:hypothetical protein GCM10010297_56380 [Streptomyces malachitofuscus]|nr:hypothetical protein GCM10010297_56380 [Streptomyces malachitofuscus]